MNKATDIELIHKVLHENDSRAFGELMQRYTSQVYGAALRLMQDEDDVQEVTQMAFIQAYKQLDSWRGVNFGAWVTIITNHLALRMLEKEKKKVRMDDCSLPNADCSMEDVAEDEYDEEHEQQLQNLEEAVNQLPEQDRQLVRWHYYDGIPLQTIADKIGQTENNVKVRISRIRERLKKKLTI